MIETRTESEWVPLAISICLLIITLSIKLVFRYDPGLRNLLMGAFLSWMGILEIKGKVLSLTYYIGPHEYKVLVWGKKGFSGLSTDTFIDESGRDVSELIGPYLGPNRDFHHCRPSVSPEFLGLEKVTWMTEDLDTGLGELPGTDEVSGSDVLLDDDRREASPLENKVVEETNIQTKKIFEKDQAIYWLK